MPIDCEPSFILNVQRLFGNDAGSVLDWFRWGLLLASDCEPVFIINHRLFGWGVRVIRWLLRLLISLVLTTWLVVWWLDCLGSLLNLFWQTGSLMISGGCKLHTRVESPVRLVWFVAIETWIWVRVKWICCVLSWTGAHDARFQALLFRHWNWCLIVYDSDSWWQIVYPCES